jgi:hypothetical protein
MIASLRSELGASATFFVHGTGVVNSPAPDAPPSGLPVAELPVAEVAGLEDGWDAVGLASRPPQPAATTVTTRTTGRSVQVCMWNDVIARGA